MSLIVAARFDSFPEAENAARRLFREGFGEDAVNIFFVNPSGSHDRYPVGGDQAADPDSRGAHYGAIAGAALLATVGALIGAGGLFLYGRTGLEVVVAGAVGAYIGSLAGALFVTGRRSRHQAQEGAPMPVRHAGVLTAVHVELNQEAEAARILREAGGMDIERAEGRWRDGKWVDFDPVSAPTPETLASRGAAR